MKWHLLTSLTASLLIASSAFAGKAHQHGAAELFIAPFENRLSFSLQSAADNILGFEHAPKNEKQRATKDQADEALKTKAHEFFVLPEGAKCQWKVDRFDDGSSRKDQRGHSDYLVQWTAECDKPLTGNIQILLGKKFSRIHKLNVSVLQDKTQHSVTLKNALGDVRL